MKELEFINTTALKEFKKLPDEERSLFRDNLAAIQAGGVPHLDFEYLNTVGPGAIELKINGHPAYRCVYVAKHKDTIWVLGAFTKTTNGTDKKLIATAHQRYKDMVQKEKERAKKRGKP